MSRMFIWGAGGIWPEAFWLLAGEARAADLDPDSLKVAFINDGDDIDVERRSAPFVGKASDLAVSQGDSVIIAIASLAASRAVAERASGLGLVLRTIIHPSALVAPNATIGPGTLITPFTFVSAGAVVGTNVPVNKYAEVAHDATVGANSVLSSYAATLGEASVGSDVFIGTLATICPGASVGDRTTVGVTSLVRKGLGVDPFAHETPLNVRAPQRDPEEVQLPR